MVQRVPPFSIFVKDGGNFVAGGESGVVSPRDYVEKTNFRRLDDAEVRREGTVLFRPNTTLPQGSQHLNIVDDVVGLWEATRPNGERAVVALTPTHVYRFSYNTGTWTQVGGPFSSCRDWQVDSMDGYLIFNNRVDLMFTYRVEDASVTPIYEMRDRGIASVGTFCVYNSFLLVADVTEIASTELAAWMNGPTPYGVVPANLCNRIRYKIAWADVGQPRNWAPSIKGTIQAATKNKVTLEYPAPFSFPVGAKLAIDGAGPNGGVLGGQSGVDDGIAVTAGSGAELTLAVAADASLTYPLTVQVTRFADTSTFVAASSIQDDSSAVLLMKSLKRGLVVYRETSIWSGRYTAQVETPFLFTPEWAGKLVPSHPRAVGDVDGNYHVYPCNRRFYRFDGAGEPRLHEPLDIARAAFFAGLTSANKHLAWCTNNPITSEVWFFCPNGVLALDYAKDTVSWIDETYSAAAYVRRPGSDDFWFILARQGKVLQYGATEDLGAITYQRLGANYVSKLKFGITSLNSDVNEKEWLGYGPLLGTDSSDFEMRVILRGGDSVAQKFETLHDGILDTPASLPEVAPYARNIYFQDEIQVATDANAVIVGRSFAFNVIRSGSGPRVNHGYP